MKLTKKLLGFLHRVFDKDPAPFLALRLRYAGAGMTWRVSDAVLTTVPSGGAGAPLAVDLRQYLLGELVNHLAAQPGYTVEYADLSELSLLSAAVLLDGSGDQALSNGDHLYAYTSVLWSYLEANAVELRTASIEIDEMLDQMSTTTADAEWLDELGSYYAVPRLQGELDASYSVRIIAEVLRPRGNNVAIESAIKVYTGQVTTVRDVTIYGGEAPLYNSIHIHDGSELHNSTAGPRYGLFDVEYGYDILGGADISGFQSIIRDLINRLRDAGTHLRSLLLQGSEISDDFTAPTDGGSLALGGAQVLDDSFVAPDDEIAAVVSAAGFDDDLDAPLDGLAAVVTTQFMYNGIRYYDGDITHRGISVSAEDIGTTGDIPFSGLLRLDGNFALDGAQITDGLI